MGLDQYAIRVKRENIINDFEFKKGELLSETNTDTLGNDFGFYYWRNFRSLNFWAIFLYCKKGGEGEFNCAYVRLDTDDLDALTILAQEDDFYIVGDFFCVNEERTQGYKSLMEFIKKAKTAIQEGDAIYYSNCW